MLRLPTRFIRTKWEGEATWTVDNNGIAFNTPLLGPELALNNGFGADTDWTKGVGWAIAGGVAVGTNTSGVLSQAVGASGNNYRIVFDLLTRTAGSVRGRAGTTTGGFAQVTPGTYACMLTHGGGGFDEGILGTTFSGTIDNVSIKALATGRIATCGWFQPRMEQAGMRIHNWANTGFVMRMPFLSDRFSGSLNQVRANMLPTSTVNFQVGMEKVVNNTVTGLIANTTVTFVPDALIEIRRINGTTFQLWYNGAQVGTDQVVTDIDILAGAWTGINCTQPEITFSEFQVNGKAVPWNFK